MDTEELRAEVQEERGSKTSFFGQGFLC